MNLKLVLLSQAKCDATEFILSESSCSIGRKRDNELMIEEFCVSNYHAEVHRNEDGDYEVTDLDSSEGTFLNRKRVSSTAKIKDGDVLKFGIIKMAVHELNEALSPSLASPQAKDGIIRFDEEPLVDGLDSENGEVQSPECDVPESSVEIEAAKERAEQEVLRLSEELSHLREELDTRRALEDEELSLQVSELEYSLAAEKLLIDAVKGKNEEFRSKIELLTADLGNALEEVSRLKATNSRKLPLPEDFKDGEAKFARLKEELALSHHDSADLRAELTDLQLELATLKGELTNREIELLEREREEVAAENPREKQLLKQIDELQARLSESDSVGERFVDEQVDLIQVREELEAQLKDTEKAAREAEKQAANLKQTNSEIEEQLKEAKSRNADLEARMEEGVLSDTLDATQIEELKEKLGSMKSEAQQTKEQLAASQDQCSDIEVLLSAKSNLASEQAAELEELHKELAETKRNHTSSEKNLVKAHRSELKALKKELQASRKETAQQKEKLECLRSDLTSLQESRDQEQTRQMHEQEAKLSQLEDEFAESIELRSEIESARNELKDQLDERDERITALLSSTGDLENRIEQAEEEALETTSLLKLTREGLSGALHCSRVALIQTTRELEAEILRRVKVESLLQESEEARKGLRSEIEALEAESDEGIVLAPEEVSFPDSGNLTEQQAEELLAFESRMASLHPTQRSNEDSNSAEGSDFSEVDFYRQLVEKLDLVDDLIQRHESKWRFAKIVKQLIVLKESFLELLETQSVDLLNLEPGTPLCMNQHHRLELVPLDDGSEPKIDPFGNTEVLETVCPGYIFHDGSRDLVIRKARVKVG